MRNSVSGLRDSFNVSVRKRGNSIRAMLGGSVKSPVTPATGASHPKTPITPATTEPVTPQDEARRAKQRWASESKASPLIRGLKVIMSNH